ncbi:hypothetical protein K488DRAFT_77097 [Vararia minispora EC-137]|uniref:Uncharacterized protein n=1 Tax=Vararia minispora EC-137 TaxID=1314806 RepID=A0ACB8QT23_9AGAM|nr:hypothetical protein K488DRAFT_77097 [Vararia minispora EC-137]
MTSSACIVHDAYRRLTYDQLVIFCFVRSLSTAGSETELAARLAHYDLHHYSFPPTPCTSMIPEPELETAPAPSRQLPQTDSVPSTTPSSSSELASAHSSTSRAARGRPPPLPVEVMADILDHVGDWELAKAVGPLNWTRANVTDHALLTGYLPLLVSTDPGVHPPTSVGAALVVRFAYTHVLAYLFRHHRALFRRTFRNGLIPVLAMHHGRVQVLDWWLARHRECPVDVPLPDPTATADAIDGASRVGSVASLEWWLQAGLPVHYTDAALENASAKNRLAVLDWWRANRERLPLKVGRVMDAASSAGAVDALAWWARSGLDYTYDRLALYHASCQGRIDVLQWWLTSGQQLFFDGDALIGATRHNKPEVLEWWDRSGLPIQYRMCDIEEALEDAIGGGERAREWWKAKGVDFNANDTEWMKLHTLNED